jgi:hypothetical protein
MASDFCKYSSALSYSPLALNVPYLIRRRLAALKSEFLEPKMTPAQIAKAGELVKEMIKKNPKLLK